MAQCARFFEMCEEAGSTFTDFCSASGGTAGSTGLPPMMMYLHFGVTELVLLRGWVTSAGWTYALTCLAVAVAAVVVQVRRCVCVWGQRWGAGCAGVCVGGGSVALCWCFPPSFSGWVGLGGGSLKQRASNVTPFYDA